jgi:hypothetical protein
MVMKKKDNSPVQPSREGGRVWLLVTILSLLGLTFLGLAVSDSIAASARLIARSG